MKIIADTHTHTVASGHAYSTIAENMRYAAGIGLRFLACTDHTSRLPGGAHAFHFTNLRVLPEEMFGVYLLRGCEVNVVDAYGNLDLSESVLRRLDLVIASLHDPVFGPQESTAAWLRVAENPLVDVIGHSGDARFPFEKERVIRAFAENGKIVEINAHSFSTRPGSPENCREIALLCKEYGVPITVSSDAHFYTGIGEFSDALQMLEEINFPKKLVANADYDRFAALMEEKSGRTFPRLHKKGKTH